MGTTKCLSWGQKYCVMRKLMFLGLVVVLVACQSDEDLGLSPDRVADVLGVPASVSPFGPTTLFYQNVAYGHGERQQLDVYLPKDAVPKGVFFYFHGGSFTAGDKSDVTSDYIAPTLRSLLDNNMALVSANYTFLTSPGSTGVLSALQDGQAVVDFIRMRQSDLQLPVNKMVIGGVSAGAGIAQWNAFRPNREAQLQGVVALAAQSSYNLYAWENVFPGLSLDALRQANPLIAQLFLGFYGGEPTPADLATMDYRAMIDATDPPLYVYNIAGDELIDAQGNIDFDVLYHSYRHSDYLRAKAIEEELPFSGAFQEQPQDFVLRVLR